MMKKLNDWSEISEKDYMWYILQGYEINAGEKRISWYLANQLHRTDGPAIEWADGSRAWWINGKRHRTDGPAHEGANGTREWWINGKRHRTDGPAHEGANGSRAWWINGIEMTETEFNERITNENKRNAVD